MGNRINIIISLLIIFSSIACESEESFKRTSIPTGTNEEEVSIFLFDDLYNLFSLNGFFIDETRCLYFQDDTGKIKVFTESGRYLRTLEGDYNFKYLFLHGKEFIGQQQNKDGTEELVFFSRDNGAILSRYTLSLSYGQWDAYKIKNGMLLFISFDTGHSGEKKAFDINKRCFISQGFSEWDNKTEEQIYSRNIDYGAEPIGELNGYYLFRFPPPPKDKSFEYELRAAKVEGDNIIYIQVILKQQDVGSGMQGLVCYLVDNRYIFTIGHPDTPRGKRPEEIWVTRIDLKVLMPDLWKPKPVDREVLKVPVNGHM